MWCGDKYMDNKNKNPNTFPSHANFKAFFEAAVLTLIAVVLVDRTVPVGTARVREVPSYAPLEEAFAALASELAVVFATGFVPAHHALDVLGLLLRRLVRRRGLRVVRGSLHGGLGGRSDLRTGQIQLARLRSRQRESSLRLRGEGALGVGHIVLGASPHYHCHIYHSA